MADYLEKLKQEMEKGITGISVKSKEVLESTRLKSRSYTSGTKKLPQKTAVSS